jgi:predicted nucleotidyltransferase
MVRPLAELDREYARRPLNAVLGAPSHIAVLRSLYTTGVGLTGREIARSSGVAVQATHDALARLAAANLVRWMQAGRAHVYELNRNHFLFKNGIQPLLEAESEFRSHIRSILKRALSGHVLSAAIFGSAARGEDRPESDLDLIMIVEREKDREKAHARTSVVSERLLREFGVRLSSMAYGRSEFRKNYRKGKSFFQTVVQEGEMLVGMDLAEVVRG